MSNNVFTLDALREEAEKQFAPFKMVLSDGTEVVLRNLLRLSKSTRDEVSVLLKKMDELQTAESSGLDHINDISDVVEKILALAADRAEPLLQELDGDLGSAIALLNKWMGETQPGEASNSPA